MHLYFCRRGGESFEARRGLEGGCGEASWGSYGEAVGIKLGVLLAE